MACMRVVHTFTRVFYTFVVCRAVPCWFAFESGSTTLAQWPPSPLSRYAYAADSVVQIIHIHLKTVCAHCTEYAQPLAAEPLAECVVCADGWTTCVCVCVLV